MTSNKNGNIAAPDVRILESQITEESASLIAIAWREYATYIAIQEMRTEIDDISTEKDVHRFEEGVDEEGNMKDNVGIEYDFRNRNNCDNDNNDNNNNNIDNNNNNNNNDNSNNRYNENNYENNSTISIHDITLLAEQLFSYPKSDTESFLAAIKDMKINSNKNKNNKNGIGKNNYSDHHELI